MTQSSLWRPRVSVRPVSFLLAALLPLIVTPAFAARTAQDFPPRAGATPIVIAIPTTRPAEAPALSASQRVDARHIALNDSYVRHLRTGHAIPRTSVTPWTIGKRLVGAQVRLRFARSASITGWWLAPGRKPFRATYAHVAGLRAFVDLGRRQVTALVSIGG